MRRPFISFLAIILFLGSFQISKAETCWTPPFQPNCSTTDTPEGNLAFLSVGSLELAAIAKRITGIFQSYNSSGWQETTSEIDYHITINYLPCIDPSYSLRIHYALTFFKWDSFTVRSSHLCCEDGYLELCLDEYSQQAITNFSLAIRNHLISYNVPMLPASEFQALQPPYHIVLGLYNRNTYNITNALANFANLQAEHSYDPTINNIGGISITLSVFYFGSQPYFANNFIKANLIYLLFLLLLLPIICSILWCLGCFKNIACCACCVIGKIKDAIKKILCCCC